MEKWLSAGELVAKTQFAQKSIPSRIGHTHFHVIFFLFEYLKNSQNHVLITGVTAEEIETKWNLIISKMDEALYSFLPFTES
jgi:hypothetical protein